MNEFQIAGSISDKSELVIVNEMLPIILVSNRIRKLIK